MNKSNRYATINVIHNLTEMFLDPGAEQPLRLAAVELRFILSSDQSAADDLDRSLFGGQQIDVSTQAGIQRVFDILNVHGAVEQCQLPDPSAGIGLKFNARPLIDLLKRMPNRNVNSGLANDFIQAHLDDNVRAGTPNL